MGHQKGKDRTKGGGKEFYETDDEFFELLDWEFGFGLDAAASKQNAKCKNFISKAVNALLDTILWEKICPAGKSVFLNPPYTRGMVNEFLRKAYETSWKGTTVVVLVHTCTDTKYWDQWVWGKAAEVRHVKGRLRFWLGKQGNTSDLPHSVIIYRPKYYGETYQSSFDWKGAYKRLIGPLPIRSKKTREIERYEK
jgi:phage N-6-adenine-methyltransferase